MSGEPSRSRRPPPLHERSQSQNNSHAIRLVPYSPPRLDPQQEGRSASQSSSATASSAQQQPHTHTQQRPPSFQRPPSLQQQHQLSSQRNEDDKGSDDGAASQTKRSGEDCAGYASSQGSALSSPSSSVVRLAGAKDGLVSGTKPASGARTPPTPTPGAAPVPATVRSNAPPPDSAVPAPASASLPPQPGPRGSSRRKGREPDRGRAVPSVPGPRPRSRRRNVLDVHSDGTFSLLPQGSGGDAAGSSMTSPVGGGSGRGSFSTGSQGRPSDLSSSAFSSLGGRSAVTSPPLSMSTIGSSSSHERLSESFLSDAFNDDRPTSSASSTAGPIPDRVHLPQLGVTTSITKPLGHQDPSTPTHTPGSSSTLQLTGDLNAATPTPASSSPWNYRILGGLRKVPKTPDAKQKPIAHHHQRQTSSDHRAAAGLSTLIEDDSSNNSARVTDQPEEQADEDDQTLPTRRPLQRPLVPKDSFASVQTTSTTSENTNYKVYGHSSSIAQQSADSLQGPPSSNNSNVQLIGESSPAAPLSFYDSSPFRPHGSSSSDVNFVLHGDPSPSPSASLAGRQPRTQYSQESLVVPPLKPARKKSYEKFGYYKQRSRENLRRADSSKSIKSISSVISGDQSHNIFVGAALLAGPSGVTRSGSPTRPPRQPQQPGQMTESHPHQWSSQLSTVMSESEGGSDRGGSPSTRSPSLATGSGNGPRRGSTGWASSTHSRQMLSISSSIAAQLESSESRSRSLSQSNSDSIDKPQPSHSRPGPSRMVRDQDEHGDGLTDLHNLSSHPSRSGLSQFFNSSSNDSSRNIHSSSSSRAGSFTSASLPQWARLYYSHERRYPLSVSESEFGDSRPSSAMRDPGSPNSDAFPPAIYSPRRRGMEMRSPAGPEQPFSDEGSMDITIMPPPMEEGVYRFRPGLRKMTSSVWSPHLRMDRRASRYTVWDPPSVTWSTGSGVFGRRNIQIMLFILGFILPFAWMIAAILPIPDDPLLQMRDQDNSQSELGMTDHFNRRILGAEELRYQSAKWWRTLNRLMSIVGVIIIAVVIALVVVGVRQGWYQRP